jgi:osmotically-inducible protein OsmY
MQGDWSIRFEVCDRLVRREDLGASNVQVSVRDGRVLLVGSVASRRDHDILLQIASSVPGVLAVDDRLVEGAVPPPEGHSEWGEERRGPLR